MRNTLVRSWIGFARGRLLGALVALTSAFAVATPAHADWVEVFDQGLTQPWTFFVVENTGKATTTGTPFAGVAPAAGGGAYLRLSHSTIASTAGGGGAAASVGIVDQGFTNGTVRSTLNAAPGDGQKSLLAVFARASANTGRGYLLGVDFRSGSLVLQRADSLAGQALTLASSEIPGFGTSKRYFVELTLNGSSLSGKVSALGNPTTLATVNAVDATISTGRAGVLLRTGYSQAGTPLDAIVGTFDDVSVTTTTGGGGPVTPPTSVKAIVPSGNGVPRIRFADGVLETSLNNSPQDRIDFEVTGVAQGATVRLYASNTLIAEQFAGGGGRIIVRTNGTNTLADGVYDLRASQAVAGTESALLDVFALRIDTIAPTKPSAPDLIDESDSGISSTDNITNASQLVIRGTAEPGASVALLIGGKPSNLPTTTADADGIWSFTVSSGKGGNYQFSVLSFDRVGNFSTPGEVTQVFAVTKRPKAPSKLTLAIEDRDPPPVKQKGAYTNNPLPTITGKGVAGASVRVTVAGTGLEYGLGAVESNGSWSVKLTRALSEGDLLIAATQTDLAGNESPVSKLLKLRFEAPIQGMAARAPLDSDSEDLGSPTDPGRFDVDGDGRVTLDDVRFVAAWVGQQDFPAEADIDEDGDVDADDFASVAAMVGR